MVTFKYKLFEAELLASSGRVIAAAAAFAGVLFAIALADRAVGPGAPQRISGVVKFSMASIGAGIALLAPTVPNTVATLFVVALSYFAAFDMRVLAVPVWPALAAAATGLLLGQSLSSDDAGTRFMAACAGLLSFVALDRIYLLLRGRSGLGFGDALIAALLGAWLSWAGLAWSVALGSVLGIVIVLARGRLHAPMPFAPALAGGAAMVLTLGLAQ